MPQIRVEFFNFVGDWNAHYIRSQRRNHVVPGKPWVLYHMPDTTKVTDYRAPLDPDRWRQLKEAAELDGVDIDAYLPTSTLGVCEMIAAELGGRPLILVEEERNSPYFFFFNRFLTRLREYHMAGNEPQLSLLESPRGGLTRIRSLFVQHGVRVNDDEEE